MEIKGLRLHRADGTVDTYDFPVTKIYVNADGSTSGSTGGDTGNTNKLYVYRSGDADFVNCSYSLGEHKTMQKPPFTTYVDPVFGDGGETYTDCVRITYRSDDTSPSSVSYFNLALNTTFADYSKLCIEACYEDERNTSEGTGIGSASCGYYDPSKYDPNTTFVTTGYVLDTHLTAERAVHEIDISACGDDIRIVTFLLKDGSPVRIYNIWLEK